MVARSNSRSSSPSDDRSYVSETLSDPPPNAIKVKYHAIDPGQKNIIKTIPMDEDGRPIPRENWEGEVNSTSLTRAHYYNHGYITKGKDTFNKWKKKRDLRLLLNAHSRENSLKTMNIRKLRKRIRHNFAKAPYLWRHMA